MLAKAVVIDNQDLGAGLYRVTIEAGDIARNAAPGQFVMVSTGDGIIPLLRRPFSVADINKSSGAISLIYQLIGEGTRLMAEWVPGKAVDMLGPLGNGFSIPPNLSRAILAGGGIGMAALLPLARELRRLDIPVTVYAGARTSDLLIGLQELREWGCGIQIATEDGSAGATGFITGPIEEGLKLMNRDNSGDTVLFACGPNPFLRVVAGLCRKFRVDAQFSLEERMGCGFGACRGCSIQTRSDSGDIVMKRVCVDGPVFKGSEVFANG